MSEQPVSEAVPVLEKLARDQHAGPVQDIAELRADVRGSDEELDEFRADWRAAGPVLTADDDTVISPLSALAP